MHSIVLRSKVAACLLRVDLGSSLESMGVRRGDEVKGVVYRPWEISDDESEKASPRVGWLWLLWSSSGGVSR